MFKEQKCYRQDDRFKFMAAMTKWPVQKQAQ